MDSNLFTSAAGTRVGKQIHITTMGNLYFLHLLSPKLYTLRLYAIPFGGTSAKKGVKAQQNREKIVAEAGLSKGYS